MTDQTVKPTEEEVAQTILAEGVDEEPVESNRRLFTGRSYLLIAALSAIYASFHMVALNGVSISDWTGIEIPFLPQFPLETWNFRIAHIAGALALGFLLFSAHTFHHDGTPHREVRAVSLVAIALGIPALIAGITAIGFSNTINSGTLPQMGGLTTWPAFAGTDTYVTEVRWFGIPLLIATFGAIVTGWFERRGRELFAASDIILALCGMVVAIYLIAIYGTAARNAVGTSFVPIGVAFAATAGAAMILELTRRVAGLALVIITGVFLLYTFTAHLLPGILAVQSPYTWHRFFGHLYSDAGILGPTTAVSSTYIILFIIFAAFLQASKVGDYFVNFAFATAGRARGGPAKVAIFASGLMGMINGTSARKPQARLRPPPRPAVRSCHRSWALVPSSWPRSPASPIRTSQSRRSSLRFSISSPSTLWWISRRQSLACGACVKMNCPSSRKWSRGSICLSRSSS
jgi:TRAP-type uncharacterized transport system fused permease subunit